MGLMIEHGGPFDEYEAVALPPAQGASDRLGSAVFLRRSARPSRRAVLHLHDLTGSFAPRDLVRWYNERGFHFYVTDLHVGEPAEAGTRRRAGKHMQECLDALDSACRPPRRADGSALTCTGRCGISCSDSAHHWSVPTAEPGQRWLRVVLRWQSHE